MTFMFTLAPEFCIDERPRDSKEPVAAATALHSANITDDDLRKHRGRRNFHQIEIETYFTEGEFSLVFNNCTWFCFPVILSPRPTKLDHGDVGFTMSVFLFVFVPVCL